MDNFFNTLRKFFAPPVFEGDDEKTRAAELMNTVLNSIIVLSTLASIALILAHAPLGQAIGSLSVIPFMLIFQIGMRRGYVRAVSILTVSFLIINMSILMPINGTVRTTSITLYMLASIIAGLTLGRQAAYWTTGVNSLIVLGVALAEMNGLLPPVARDTALQQGLIFAVMSIMTVILLNQALGRIQFAMNQLAALNVGLEERIAERTKALVTSAEVSRRLTSILDPNELAAAVVNQIQSAFNYYYAQIYLFDEAGENLVLTAGTGEAGAEMMKRGHRLPKGRGLVGRAAESNKSVLVSDTSQDPNWLPNELLPDTRTETAIPIAIANRVLGVLDVQDDATNDITSEDVTLLESLAGQVAISLQNARQYEETQHTSLQLSEALNIAKLANWEYDVNRDRFIFNDHFYSIFHTTAEQEGGYELSSAEYAERFVHPEDHPLVGIEIEKALKSTDRHYSAGLEHKFLYRDGSGAGYMSVEVHIDRDDRGNILRYYGANQDITERKSLEVLMTQRARQQETINTITQKVQSATTIEDAMQVAARELGHALGNRQTLVALEPSALGGIGKKVAAE